ncbi:calcium-dependent phosphotriesterase [Hypoxylon sp. FL1150]|nr:calcium-dependent phosphotriesterase [Hypoxylon sp. FL1150]
MALRTALIVLLLTAVSPIFSDLSRRAILMWQNAPGRLTAINTFKSHEVKFADKTRSCEDGLLVESKGIAIISCDPGRERWNTVMGLFLPEPIPGGEIYAYDYKKADAPDSDSFKRFEILGYAPGSNLHTLGMAFHEETSTLFVANHRSDGPTVEMFTLDFVAHTATYFRTIRHPLLRGPNSLTLLNSHELLVTNDHHFLIKEQRILSRLETYLGLPLGTVVHVDISPLIEDPAHPVKAKVLTRVAFANGIEKLNDTTVAVASTSRAAVYLFDLASNSNSNSNSNNAFSPPTLTYRSIIKFPFMVDNLRVTSDGALLAAGHPYAFSLEKYSQTRHLCNDPDELAAADLAAREYCASATAASWVSKWTEEGGIEDLYVGADFPTSSTAAFDAERKVGIVTGLYAKGILVWRE